MHPGSPCDGREQLSHLGRRAGGLVALPAPARGCRPSSPAPPMPTPPQGRPHRFVYGYSSQFEEPSIGIAKVRAGEGGPAADGALSPPLVCCLSSAPPAAAAHAPPCLAQTPQPQRAPPATRTPTHAGGHGSGHHRCVAPRLPALCGGAQVCAAPRGCCRGRRLAAVCGVPQRWVEVGGGGEGSPGRAACAMPGARLWCTTDHMLGWLGWLGLCWGFTPCACSAPLQALGRASWRSWMPVT